MKVKITELHPSDEFYVLKEAIVGNIIDKAFLNKAWPDGWYAIEGIVIEEMAADLDVPEHVGLHIGFFRCKYERIPETESKQEES